MNLFEWGDDFTYVRGKHSLKTGVSIKRIRNDPTTGGDERGEYTFSTFQNLLRGVADNLGAGLPGFDTYRGWRQSLIGVYVQDDFNVTPQVTLNLGLRWETATDPSEVNGKISVLPAPEGQQFDWFTSQFSALEIADRAFHIVKKTFEPRVGIAWRINESGRTVLRAGGGIYHTQLLPWAYANDMSANPPFFQKVSADNPGWPNGFQDLKPEAGLIRITITDRIMKTPATNQWTVSFQQQLFGNTVAEVSYAGSKSNNLLGQKLINYNRFEIRDGQKFYPPRSPRLNPNWHAIHLLPTELSATYNSVSFSLRRPSSTGPQYQIFYGGPDKYYDPTVFSLPLTGTYGNLGRNTIIGPGLAKLDLSLGKSTNPGSSISVIDIAAQKEIRRIDIGPRSRPHGLWYAGGKLYFTAEGNQLIGCYNPATNQIEWRLGVGQTRTHLLLLTKDLNRIFASNTESHTVSVFERVPEPEDWSHTIIPVGKRPQGIDISPDGTEVWVTNLADGSISIIDVATKKVRETLGLGLTHPIRMKFTHDGKRVLVSDDRAHVVVVMDAAARKEIKRFNNLGKGPEGFLIPPAGDVAYVAVQQDKHYLAIIDLKTLEPIGQIPTGTMPGTMAWVEKR